MSETKNSSDLTYFPKKRSSRAAEETESVSMKKAKKASKVRLPKNFNRLVTQTFRVSYLFPMGMG